MEPQVVSNASNDTWTSPAASFVSCSFSDGEELDATAADSSFVYASSRGGDARDNGKFVNHFKITISYILLYADVCRSMALGLNDLLYR